MRGDGCDEMGRGYEESSQRTRKLMMRPRWRTVFLAKTNVWCGAALPDDTARVFRSSMQVARVQRPVVMAIVARLT